MNDMNDTRDIDELFATARSHPDRFGANPAGAETGTVAFAARIEENLRVVHAELDAPREPRLARALRRLGVPDLTIPLVTATPALRRSWFVAVAIAVLFALSVATGDGADDVERIAFFLTLAPLVPLLGVALAFGRGVDPTHDIVVAAPRDTFRVFLVRSVTVLVASSVVLLVGSLMLPTGGVFRVAWLLPALALTALTMALAAGRDARVVAAFVAAVWIVVVIVVTGAASSAAMFGAVTQLVAIVVGAAALVLLAHRRRHIESTGARA